MKQFHPHKLILGATGAFLTLISVGICFALFHETGKLEKITASILAVLTLALAFFIWLSRRVMLKFTDQFIAQVGWRPWRLEWSEVDAIRVKESGDGRCLEIVDRCGRIFTPAVFLFLTRSQENSLISALMEYKAKQPNQALEPTRTAVTDRADARSAPAVRVAHL
jgi:hypothetical protein